jgi:hypothetical protein
MEIRTAELSIFEAEIAIFMLKRYKSPGIIHILVELIQAGSEIHKLISPVE